MGRVRRQCVNRGAGFAPGPSWLGHRSPAAESARTCWTGNGTLSPGPAGNSGTTDDRSPNAGIILIKPPAQRRMGVKRRLVDQGLWFNAGGIVAPARFSCCMTLDICDTGPRIRTTGNGFGCSFADARCQEFEPGNQFRRTYCPQAGGRCSVTGRLWPFPDRDGETGPATRLWRKTGELHRQPHRVGNAGGLFAGCKNA